MAEKQLKTFRIRFEGDAKDAEKAAEQLKRKLREVGEEAARVTTKTRKVTDRSGAVSFRATTSAVVPTNGISSRGQATALAKQLSAVVPQTTALKDFALAERIVTKEAKKAAKAVGELNTRHRLGVKHVLKYSAAYAGAGSAIFAFVNAIKQIPAVGKELQTTQGVFKSVFGGLEGANEQMKYLNDLADESHSSLSTLQESYRQFAASTVPAGVAVAEVQGIFTNMTKTARALSLSNEKVELSMRALTQIFSKNKVTAEEAQNQLAEHLPGSMAILAEAYQELTGKVGNATEILRKDMEQGLVRPQGLLLLVSQRLFKKFEGAYEDSKKRLDARYQDFLTASTRVGQEIFIRTEGFLSKAVALLTNVANAFAAHTDTILASLKALGTALSVMVVLRFPAYTKAIYAATLANTAFATSFLRLPALTRLTNRAMDRAGKSTDTLGGKLTALGIATSILGKNFLKKLGIILKAPSTYGKLIAALAVVMGMYDKFEAIGNKVIKYHEREATVLEIVRAVLSLYGKAWERAKKFLTDYFSTKPLMERFFTYLENKFPTAGRAVAAFTEKIKLLNEGWARVKSNFLDTFLGKAINRVYDEVDALKAKEEAERQAAEATKARQQAEAEAAQNAIVEKAKADAREALAEAVTDKASKKQEDQQAKLQKAYEAEIASLDEKIRKLTLSGEAYFIASAKAKGYTDEMIHEIVLRKQQIESLEAAKERREKEAEALQKGKDTLRGYREELATLQQLTNDLRSNPSAAGVADAQEFANMRDAVQQLPESLRAEGAAVLEAARAQRQLNAQLEEGISLSENLRSEQLSRTGSLAEQVAAQVAGAAPEQRAALTKQIYALMLTETEESLLTEEERWEASWRRRHEIVLKATEEGETKRATLLAKLQRQRDLEELKRLKKKEALIFGGTKQLYDGLYSLMEASAGKSEAAQRRLFAVQKAISLAKALMDTYSAATSAMAAGADPATKFAAYAAVLAQGLTAVSIIRSTEVDAGAFATGGNFTVPGVGGTDTVPIRLLASPGEQISVKTPAQQQATTQTEVAAPVINIINNTPAEITTEERTVDGQTIIDILIEDIETSGRASATLQKRFGLSRKAG